ncbi:hypothetical protein QM012_001811 [Aureobasidium pullulans]|uniref:Glycine zipper 2TM domain-containing protein n=1 Tax=Aureobasidium pullulans TaxID=5580 RepID=A0ABR0TCK1_AURPU
MDDPRGRDRGYDSGSDDSYYQRPRRRSYPKNDRDDRRPRRYDNREIEPPRRPSPPGQSYHPRAVDPPAYIPYQQGATRPGDFQYYDNSPRPSSRGDYPPSSSTRGAPNNEMARYSRPKDRSPSRSRSRRRQRRRSYSSSSRSRSSNQDFHDSPLMALDSRPLGLGAGIAGALIGGYIGRETSDRHQKRGTALGAIIGGIGANILENRVRIYREDMKEEQREAKEKWEAKQREGKKERRSRRLESPQRW